jgi:AraC-like DNA-binding protein
MHKQPKYLNYTTPMGISLSGIARAALSSFLIHESGYQSALKNWNHEAVDSPFWRLYHNPKPGCFLRFQGQLIPLQPDSLMLIPANTIFDCCGPMEACHFWLHFTVNRLTGSVAEQPIILEMQPLLKSLIDAVIETHQLPAGAARDQRVHHQSAALLHAVFAEWNAPPPEPLPERLLEILALIQKAPHSNLSNPFLAELSGMSVEKFIREFRQHTGHTPAAYVLSTRLRLAGESLALTDHTIDQIAAQNGFPNRHYLSRMFTRQFGCGPAEFRERQHRKRGR